MKKITTLLLAAGMVFAASAPASAVDVKVDGQYVFDYQVGETFKKNVNNFSGAGQRLRLGLTLAASENLSGYVQFQDDQQWGTAKDKHGDKDIQLRQAYIDWIIPQTPVKVRMGRQQLGLPGDALSGAWNAIMTTPWAGRDAISVSAPVADFMNVTAFWFRSDADGAKEDVSDSNTDAFGAVVDLKFDGLSVSPWVMYANIDKNFTVDKDTKKNVAAFADNIGGWDPDNDEYDGLVDANAYWVGFSSTLSYFDPFTLKLSGAYGAKSYAGGYKDTDGKEIDDRHGWYLQGKASYKTAYGSPFLGAWYASGDDKGDYMRQGWIPTLGGRYGVTVMANGNSAASNASYPGAHYSIGGTWGVTAGIENVSFLEDLTHTFSVTLYKGTNNSEAGGAKINDASEYDDAYNYLLYEDTLVEFDLVSTYQIYKNLSATLELGYILADIDEKHHGATDDYKMTDNAWRAGMIFQYKF